ncbi:MAG: hypothetical protein ACJ741_11300 [Pyrinomonadaceae bacterium]
MHRRSLAPLLIALLTLSLPAVAVRAQAPDREADAAVKKFLASKKTAEESAEAAGSATGDLDGDGKPELALVWTTMGPTYWHNTLTVFAQTAGAYKPLASFDLDGEAQLSAVKGGVITVAQTLYAKTDPICCPTVKKLMRYRLVGKKISVVKK